MYCIQFYGSPISAANANGREEKFMSELSIRFRSAAVVVGFMLLGSLPSKAATYNFDFTSASGYSVVGSLTTGNADGTGFDITSISGSIVSVNPVASGSIQGLMPGNATPPLYLTAGAGGYGSYYYDNIFIPTAPYFTTTGGLLFTSTAGFEYNFYGGGGCCGSAANTTYLSTTDGGVSSGFYPGISGTLTVTDASPPEDPPSPVPLPAALPLFATGVGALGLLGWRRRGKLLF